MTDEVYKIKPGTVQSRAKGRLKAISHGAPASILRNLPAKAVEEARVNFQSQVRREREAALEAAAGKRDTATYGELVGAVVKLTHVDQLMSKLPTQIVEHRDMDRDPRDVLLDMLAENSVDVISSE